MPKNRRCLARITLLLVAALAISSTMTTRAYAVSRANKPRKLTDAKHEAAPAKRPRAAGSLPAQGIFGGCDIASDLTACEQQLVQIHQSGLQVVVVDAEWASLDQLSAYAAYAQSVGMSVMWELNDPGFWGGDWIGANAAGDWSSFSTACDCTGTDQVLDYMIQWLSELPATYGYYAADDSTLEPDQAAGLKAYVSEIKSVDPTHMVMVGSAEGQGTTYYSSGATIGNEIYPETTQSLMPYDRNLAIWQAVQQGITQDQRAANGEGANSAFILQAFSFGDNIYDGEAVGACTATMTQAQCASRLQYPSASVQLELRNEALQYADPKLILWYTYSQASLGGHWADLTSVVNAPYPVSASTARARKTTRAHSQRTPHRRPGALSA